ncbi:MAG TPA: hypothetical protein VF006_08735 [Longimicrobium sp.]
MIISKVRLLTALVAAGALAAGGAEASTSSDRFTSIGSSPSREQAALLAPSSAPLSVYLRCDNYGFVLCEAQAYGGSGNGYSFTWDGDVQEVTDDDGSSASSASNPYFYCTGYSTVGVYVRDSLGAGAYASAYVC